MGHGALGALYSAATLVSAAILPWAGKRIDSSRLPRYAAAVILGLAGAVVLMALAAAPWQLFLAFLALRLFGQGLSSHTGMTATARLAPSRRRGKSLSLAGLGMSVGEAAAPPIVAALLIFLAWREVWLAAAVAQVCAVLLLAQWLLRGLPSSPPAPEESEGGLESWTRGQVLTDRRFWLAAPALFAPPCVVTALFFNQFSLAEYKGVPFAEWTAGVAAYSAGSVLASLVSGWLTDKFTGARVVKWILLPLIMSALLAAHANFAGLSFAYYALMGMSAGMSVPAVGALWAEIYGTAHLGAVRSLAHAVVVLFSAVGPVIYGVLLDAEVSWPNILMLTAAYMAAASILLWLTPLRPRAAN